jgi:gamma-glutamylcyclotransferase
MQHETWYFAYGSNLSKQQMLRRTGSVPESQRARLLNYRLAFRKVLGGSDVFATIVPSQGAMVRGVVYRCDSHAMDQLDQFEGVAENCYRREWVSATSDATNEIVRCIAYIGESFALEDAVPDDNYLDRILTGAREHGWTELF